MSNSIKLTFVVSADSESYSVGLSIDGGIPLDISEVEKYTKLANEATEGELFRFIGDKLMEEAAAQIAENRKPKKVIWEG